MGREKPQRMSRIQNKSLFIRHFREILHGKPVLCPVLEHRTVSSICYKLVGMLCHRIIKIVAYHKHNGCSLYTLVREVIYTAGIYLVIRPVPVHIYPAVLFQFLRKLRSQGSMLLCREIPEGILQCQSLLLQGKYVLSPRSVVYCRIISFGLRYNRRYTLAYSFSEIIHKSIL